MKKNIVIIAVLTAALIAAYIIINNNRVDTSKLHGTWFCTIEQKNPTARLLYFNDSGKICLNIMMSMSHGCTGNDSTIGSYSVSGDIINVKYTQAFGDYIDDSYTFKVNKLDSNRLKFYILDETTKADSVLYQCEKVSE